MRKITLDQIFKIGMLIIAFIFLLFYLQSRQNGRYQLIEGGAVIDTRDGTIYHGYDFISNPVKGEFFKSREDKMKEKEIKKELKKAEEKKKTETKEMYQKRLEYINAGFTNDEIDKYFEEKKAKEEKEEGKLTKEDEEEFFKSLAKESKEITKKGGKP